MIRILLNVWDIPLGETQTQEGVVLESYVAMGSGTKKCQEMAVEDVQYYHVYEIGVDLRDRVERGTVSHVLPIG